MANLRAHRLFSSVTSASVELVAFEPPSKRLWVVIECDYDTGIPMAVLWGEGSDSANYGHVILQPGESIIFSKNGALWWDGNIWVQGSGGTAVYRGAEVYQEPAERRSK